MSDIDTIPSDLGCQCRGGRRRGGEPVWNAVRQYEDPDDVTFDIMNMKYGSAYDILTKGINVRVVFKFDSEYLYLNAADSRLTLSWSRVSFQAWSGR